MTEDPFLTQLKKRSDEIANGILNCILEIKKANPE